MPCLESFLLAWCLSCLLLSFCTPGRDEGYATLKRPGRHIIPGMTRNVFFSFVEFRFASESLPCCKTLGTGLTYIQKGLLLLLCRRMWCQRQELCLSSVSVPYRNCKCVGVRSGISPTWHWFQDYFRTAVIHSSTVGKFLIFVFQIPFTWECWQLYSALPLSLKGSWTELQFLSPFWDIHSQENGTNEGAGDIDQHPVWSEGCRKIDRTGILSLHGVSSLLRWGIRNRVKFTISNPPGQVGKIQVLRVTLMDSSLSQPRLQGYKEKGGKRAHQ